MQLTFEYILFFLVTSGVAFLWLSYLKTVDVFRPDSWKKLLLSFFAGWFSVLPALGTVFLQSSLFAPDSFLYFLVDIGLVEESGKLLIVFLVLRFLVRTDEPVDYLVHAAAVACGFAAVENILYSKQFGIDVLRSRAVISVFMHMAFTALPVYAFILGRSLGRDTPTIFLQSFSGFLLAVAAHGLYDFFLVSGLFILAFFLFFVLIEVWLTQLNNLLNLSPWFNRQAVPNFKSIRNRLLIGFVLLTALEIGMEFNTRGQSSGWLGYTLQITLLFAVPMLMIMSKFANLRLIPGKIFPFHVQLLNTLKVSGFRPNRDDTPFSSPMYNLRIDTPVEMALSAMLYKPVLVVERGMASGIEVHLRGLLSEKYWLQEDEVFFGFRPGEPLYAEGFRSDLWLIKAKTVGQSFYEGHPEGIVYFIPEGLEPGADTDPELLSPRVRCFVKALE